MLPAQYFEIICCPRCRGDLVQAGEERLRCLGCAAEYPVVEGVPVLLAGGEDEVSRTVSSFYEGAWKQTWRKSEPAQPAQPAQQAEQAQPAKLAHDDSSDYGIRYVRTTEYRFLAEFQGRGGRKRFFLDAACGAFPRRDFGKEYTYHVCLDFTLEGLLAARRLMGERALCVCGSLLRVPLKDGVFDGILASHCVYHIDKDLQGTAVRELLRTLAPGGKLVVFYANPDNVSSRLLKRPAGWPLRALLDRARRYAPPPPPLATDTPKDAPKDQAPVVYCYLHPIEAMMRELTSVHPDARVSVRPLCLLPYDQRAPLFQQKGAFSALAYGICMGLEKLYERRPDMSYYLTYIAERRV
jgi:SAM-dependent methyltransferase/uncharacterized protein YbaR (Trm112 family)